MGKSTIGVLVSALLFCASGASAQARAIRVEFDRGAPGAAGLLEAAREISIGAQVPAGVRESRGGIEIRIGIGDGDQRHGGWDRGRGRRWRGSNPWRWERVKRAAHEVEERAEHVHREAERRAHHDDWRETQFLRDCHRLEQAARHFHRQVESYRQEPYHTLSDYGELMNAFRRADSSRRYSHADQHVRADFEALRRELAELDFYYRGRWDDHGRDDHGHDDGHGRWPRGPRRW